MDYNRLIETTKDVLFYDFEKIFYDFENENKVLSNNYILNDFKDVSSYVISYDGSEDITICSMLKSKCDNDIYKFIAYYLISESIFRDGEVKLSSHEYLKNNEEITVGDFMMLTKEKFNWKDIFTEIGESYNLVYKSINHDVGYIILFIDRNENDNFYVVTFACT